MDFASALHSRLEAAIASDGLGIGAAACHGLVCGLLCGTQTGRAGGLAEALALLAEDAPPEAVDGETQGLLRHTMNWTAGELGAEDFRLALVLPDDEAPLTERALALGDWVRGYLLGLGLAGPEENEPLGGDVREVLTDFGEIARIGGELEAGEDAERNLLELTEFVRVGAMTVYEARGGQHGAT